MKILVVGVGYIGISSLLYFSKAGVDVSGIDIDLKKVEMIKKGEMPQKDLEAWLDFKPGQYLKKIRMFGDFYILDKEIFDVIFIAIPTEKNGEPWFEPLQNVVKEINNSKNKESLVIIESTLTPGISEKYLVPHIKNFAVAPRTDWFGDKDKTLTALPRVAGGNNQYACEKVTKILGKVCKTIHVCSYKEAELVKAVQNCQRHLGIIFTNQLAMAYPTLDIRKVMNLAGLKWNCESYYPSLSVGGYCINLASHYILMGADNNTYLSLPEQALNTDHKFCYKIMTKIFNKQPRSVAILGTAYLANIKVDILSAGSKLIRAFKYYKTQVDLSQNLPSLQIYDSLYSKEELEKKYELPILNFPDDLDKFEYIFVTAGHKEFKELDPKIWIEKTKNAKLIFDNTGDLEHINFKCPYSLIGRANWLKELQ